MRSTWKVLVPSALLLTGTPVAQAEFVGLNIGPGEWDAVHSNSFDNTSDDPGYQPGTSGIGDDQSTPSFLFVIEHPISILPNFRYQGSEFDSNGSNSLNGGSLSFNNQSYGNSSITSSHDLAHNDIVLYYELIDNWVNLDFGLDLKSFAGEISMSDSSLNNTVLPVDETIPLFYLSARFNLPFNGFYVGADINSNFSVSDSVAEDSTFMLGYKSENGARVEGGIKMFSLDLNEPSDIDASLEYDGLFINGYIPF